MRYNISICDLIFQVCITNGFNYNDGSIASYSGTISLTGLYFSDSPTSVSLVSYFINSRRFLLMLQLLLKIRIMLTMIRILLVLKLSS